MLDKPVFQVSECIEVLNRHLSLLGEIVVEGEISRFDIKNGKLIFGTIKDATSSLDIFTVPYLVKNYRQFEPGMLIHAYGTPGLYKGSGKFRFYVKELVPQGEGALQVAYEKLKRALEAEGLFAPERKRPLPPWPKTIGLITAPNSSAHADLLKIISARMGGLTLRTIPVNVQGREAVPTLLKAYAYINIHPRDFDLIIMARGGGSLEDLAAFNSEEVCRSVFACKVPVISAIGHEDNWSLTDFVADLRASTPSNAAELCVRDRHEVIREISLSQDLMHSQLVRTLKSKIQTVDIASSSIRRRLKVMTATVAQTINKIPVMAISLKSLIKNYDKSLDHTLPGMYQRLCAEVVLKRNNLVSLERLLASLDYRNVLKRGYSITRLGQRIITHSGQVKSGDSLTTQLADTEITSIVN